MKRTIYITAFTFLGILIQFLIHGLIEIWYIGLLISNFSKYGLGLSWSQWFLIHHLATVTLFIIGALFGFLQGKFWWEKIYGKSKQSKI